MVLCLNPPVRCDDVLPEILQGISKERNGRGEFESQATRSIKILQCINCRTPFCSNMNQPIETVHRLDGTPYPNFCGLMSDPSFHHVKEGANVEIQGPTSFHISRLSNGKSLLLQKVVCTTCHKSAGFQVACIIIFRGYGDNANASGGGTDLEAKDMKSKNNAGGKKDMKPDNNAGGKKDLKPENNAGGKKDMKPDNNVGGGYSNIAAEGEGGVELEVGHFLLEAKLSKAIP